MNTRLLFKVVGFILMLEGAAMALPVAVALWHRESDTYAFLLSAVITELAGAFMFFLSRKEKGTMYTREAFSVVGLSWTLLALFGALPYYISGAMPSFADCIFESMSGFTTTGATILTDIESLPRGILFWRSLTHWLGGMGVLILFLALLPSMGMRSQSLVKAESSGPTPGKIVPRIAETARILYIIYAAMTVILIVCLIAMGIKPFDAVNVAFSTAATGGFAVTNLSIGAYNHAAAEIVIAVFMLLFSVSFTIYHAALTRKWAHIKTNTELKWFGAIVAASVIVVWISIGANTSFGEGFRKSFFHVASIMSSTGFSTANYSMWPDTARFVLVLLMFVGACGGSTGGGVKVARVAILFKAIRREIKKIMHPRSTPIVRMNGKAADDTVISGVLLFLAAYVIVLCVAVLLVSIDGLGFVTTFTASLATLGNTGLGLDAVGPGGSFSQFSPFSKIVLSFCMLVGRLEIFPILVILSPSAWGRK